MKTRTAKHRSFSLEDLIWPLFVVALLTVIGPQAHAQQLSQPVSLQLTAANNACTGSGFSLSTLVQLTVNGSNVGAPQPCGQAVTFANVVTVAGTYAFALRSGNSAGFAVASPPKSYLIGEPVIPPVIPGTTFTLTCGTPPVACPAPIVITPLP